MLSSQKKETVLILKKVSQKFLILLNRSTQLDGMFGLSNSDEKKGAGFKSINNWTYIEGLGNYNNAEPGV